MFRTEIIIDARTYLELAGRKSGEKEILAITMRGQGSAGQATLASLTLTKPEVEQLKTQLTDWLASLKG